MTSRERIADWLTGGALTRARDDRDRAEKHMTDGYYGLRAAKTFSDKKASEYLAWGNERHADWLLTQVALRAIIANDTPNANATVKRMVRIAKEALE